MSTPTVPGNLQDLARSHVEVHAKGKGGNTKFSCNHCKRNFTGSLTRQLAHLTGETGTGVAACDNFDDDTRLAIYHEVERLQRVKSGSKASSCQLSTSGS